MEVAAPIVVEYVPGAHSSHSASAVPPAEGRYLPAPQLVHVEREDAPEASEYLPGPHARHVLEDTAPTVKEYFPGPHKWQIAADPTENFPGPQLMHSLSPASALYLPTEHPTHVSFTRVKPALQ